MTKYDFSNVYEDEDGWYRFHITDLSGTEFKSQEFFTSADALKDLKYVQGSIQATDEFLLNLNDGFCPICGRANDGTMSAHHLVPKCKKGKDTVSIHRVCHDAIHATFTDKELSRDFNTVEKLLGDARIQKFVRWVEKKAANFTNPSIMSNKKNPNKHK